jgi:uncharacterized delta-60 repeat protein
MKRVAISQSVSFTPRLLLLALSIVGVFLAVLATASPRKLPGEGPHAITLAPFGSVQEAWVTRYNGPGHDFDAAEAIAVDNSGNVYVTGRSSDPDFSTHFATVKYDPQGQELWVARYYGPGNYQDTPTGIAVDQSGNVYVTGYSFGSSNNYDYATIKYNPDGKQQWVARYNGPDNGDDGAEGIALDSLDNVYVTGSSANTSDFSDYATIKYNSAGQEQWVRRYHGRPGNYRDDAHAIAVDGSGNAYVTGASLFYTIASYDYGTIHYDSAGQQQSVARYNGPGQRDDYGTAIAVDHSGNVYVTGSSWGSDTDYDYATVKYNSTGQQLWVARYDGPASASDYAQAIVVDNSGNVCVTGASARTAYSDFEYATVKYDSMGRQQWIARYSGPANLDDQAHAIALDSSGNAYVTGQSVGLGTDYDYATIKYDLSGNEQWVVRYNGPANYYDTATAIAVDASENVYVTGSSANIGSSTDLDYTTIKYMQPVTSSPTPTATPTTTPASTARPHPTPRLRLNPRARP